MEHEIKFKAYLKEDFQDETVLNADKILHKGMYNVTGLHFYEGDKLTSISVDTKYWRSTIFMA